MGTVKVDATNAWILRPKPHGMDQMDYFLAKNRICIGYPLGESFEDCNYTDLKRMLRDEDTKRQHNDESSKWINGLSTVKILVRDMRIGDVVVVPYGNDIYFATIESDYIYVKELDEDKIGSGFPHQRIVKWECGGKPISRHELPSPLRESLQFPGTAANIKKHISIVNNLLNEEMVIEKENDKSNIQSGIQYEVIKFVESVFRDPEKTVDQRLMAADLLLSYGQTKK